MKGKLIINCIAAMFFSLVGTANADPLQELDCSVMNAASVEGQANLVYMLDGIISASDETTITSLAWLEALYAHTENFCRQNPSAKFADAMNSLPEYPADSTDLDMDKIPCSTLATSDSVGQTQIITWWIGFSAEFYEISLADDRITNFSNNYGSFCATYPDAIPTDFLVAYFE